MDCTVSYVGIFQSGSLLVVLQTFVPFQGSPNCSWVFSDLCLLNQWCKSEWILFGKSDRIWRTLLPPIPSRSDPPTLTPLQPSPPSSSAPQFGIEPYLFLHMLQSALMLVEHHKLSR